MRILIDTNIFIAAEAYGDASEVNSPIAANLLRLSVALGHTIVVSDATRRDLMNADPEVRSKRITQLEKFHVLRPIPVDPELRETANFPQPLSANDDIDLRILNDLRAGVANFLVTDDGRLRARARNAGLQSRVMSLIDAVGMLEALTAVPPSIRTVELVFVYELDPRQEFFVSIREDYPEFDIWFNKIVGEERQAIILGSPESLEGLAILKPEFDQPWRLPANVLKISTFKIAEARASSGRGELLLRSVIEFARANQLSAIYLEVFPTKIDLIQFIEDFGFHAVSGMSTHRGETIFVKRLVPVPGEVAPADPLSFNKEYGPGQLLIERAHIVPIQPRFHSRLFPDLELQLELLPRTEPYGNAIRKAYLSRSPTRRIMSGDCLLFHRTGGSPSSVTALGVAEGVIVSNSPDEIVQFVGNRTVYSHIQIAGMCEVGEVLAIKFRFDRTLKRRGHSRSCSKRDLWLEQFRASSAFHRRGYHGSGLDWKSRVDVDQTSIRTGHSGRFQTVRV